MKHEISLVLFLISSVVSSCAQENTRKDIEDKLQGTWTGVIKDIDLKVTNEITIVFDRDNFAYKKNYSIDSLGNKKVMEPSNKKYRVFIYSNKNIEVIGDTVIERKPNIIKSAYREPLYLKLHFVNKDEIRLLPLFKYNEQQLLGSRDDLKWGFYLKREKPIEDK
jgi:hypothetical protein